MNEPVSRRFKPSSRSLLTGDKPNTFGLLRLSGGQSRHHHEPLAVVSLEKHGGDGNFVNTFKRVNQQITAHWVPQKKSHGYSRRVPALVITLTVTALD